MGMTSCGALHMHTILSTGPDVHITLLICCICVSYSDLEGFIQDTQRGMER